MTNILLASGGPDIDFMIKGVFSYQVFGQTAWITTTHVCLFIVILAMSALMIFANRVMKKATEVPGAVQSVLEMLIEMLDNFVGESLGKNAKAFRNFIGTIFFFIWICNTSGLFGLRAPTADYGVTLSLAICVFLVVNVTEFRHQKVKGYWKNLLEPMPLFLPMNIISKLSILVSLSLRLFANNLSGVMMMALVYTLLRPIAIAWPGALHAFFDVFVGSLQAYVFCVLSLSYLNTACGDE